MSKVTIKFWDKQEQKYEELRWLAIDDDMEILEIEVEHYATGNINSRFEPHFFVNGERIA